MTEITTNQPKRAIKSFVLRSRMTAKQKMAIDKYWVDYGIQELTKPLDYEQLFGRNAATILEIGFGMGGSLLELARQHPDVNFLGIEVHRPGIGSLLLGIKEQDLKNIRVICADAVMILQDNILDASLSGVLLFFPDPWPKKRHQKRRIVQSDFVNLIHQKLKNNGYFHLATDVTDYADHMVNIISQYGKFQPLNDQENSPTLLGRPKTKFELRGQQLGHCIKDLIYRKS